MTDSSSNPDQNETQGEQRLDKYLVALHPQFSRTYFQELIQDGLVLVNGQAVKKHHLVKASDEVEVEFRIDPALDLEPANIALDILYEDEALIVINKQAGLVVHPAPGNYTHTLVNALLYHTQIERDEKDIRPGIVHRLDKDTSGVLVVAKTRQVHGKLVEAFSSRKVGKRYVALCAAKPSQTKLEWAIQRHPRNRKKMMASSEGKPALTEVLSAEAVGPFWLLELALHTGRTHQIRVHLEKANAPILGDPVYGSESLNRKWKLQRQLLHAKHLSFDHPLTGERLNFEAPLPEDFKQFLEKQS